MAREQTCTVLRYCRVKYHSWEAVSSSRNWNPAEVMHGASPASLTECMKQRITLYSFLLAALTSNTADWCLPLHEAGLDEELSEVLADRGARGAHHEVQNHLPALHGVAVQAIYVPRVPIRAETTALVCPRLTSDGQEIKLMNTNKYQF